MRSSKRTSDGSQLLWSLVVLTACLFFVYFIFYRLDDPEAVKELFANNSLGNAQVSTQNQNNQEGSANEGPSADTIIFATQTARKGNGTGINAETNVEEDDAFQGNAMDDTTQTNTNSNTNRAGNNVMQDTDPEDGTRMEDGKTFFSTQSLFDQENDQESNQQGNNGQNVGNSQDTIAGSAEDAIPLSGTFRWEGELRSLRDFGLLGQEQYIQKTVYNSHFVFLGDFAGNLLDQNNSELTDEQRRALIPGLEEMGGNIVAITDKIDIQENGLYGDRIWFLNTERYEQLEKVVYIAFFDQADDVWFVQMDRERYYNTKPLIRDIFDDWYDW